MRKIFVLLLLVTITRMTQAETLRQTTNKTFEVKSGSSLSLENVNGGITVTSWDQPRISVTAEKIVERTDAAEARQAMAELRVEMSQAGDRVTVRTGSPKSHSGFWDMLFGNWNDATVRYTIMVPRASNLDLDDTNGAVEVTGVTGVLKIGTTNGHIALTHCGGSLEANSTNGRVVAELLTLDSHGVRMETTNGRVEITLPASVRADLDASTTNGHVESDLPITTRSAGKDEMRGTINGGGVVVRLRTTNGAIRIHSAATVSSQVSR